MKVFRAGWKVMVMVFSLSLLVSCGGGGASPVPGGGGGGNNGDPLVSEGSSSVPKDLGTAPLTYAGGSVGYAGGKSFYQFKTARAGSYVINLKTPSIRLKWDLVPQKSDLNGTNDIANADNIFAGTLTDVVATAKNLDGDTFYYLEVMDYSPSGGTYTISIQLADSEGSINTPIVLTPDGSSHAGGIDVVYGYSYYKFTTAAAGSYLIGIKGLSVPADGESWTIYSDSGFLNQVPGASCNTNFIINGDLVCGASNLPAGTYYLKVINFGLAPTSYTIAITPDGIGYAGTAVTLNPDTHATGTIYNNELQYYSFTPVSSGTYTITLTASQDISWGLYSDVTCSTLVKACSYGGYPVTNMAKCTTGNLPRQTYYLKVTNNATSTGSYDLIASGQGGSEGAVGDPVVVAPRAPLAGHVAPGESSYYTFRTETLTNPSPYLITLTGLTVPPTAYWISWSLYADAGFPIMNEIAYCSGHDYLGNIVCSTNEGGNATAVLDPNASYYLRVTGSNVATYLTYSVMATPLSGETGCSANGTCYNFEGNSMTPFVAYGNDPVWVTASPSGTGGAGSYNAQSGIVGKNQTLSCFVKTLTGVKWVSFSSSTQFGTGTDELDFYIDWVGTSFMAAKAWTGTNAWERVVFKPSDSGAHTYGWCHAKPDTGNVDNNAWVDDIEFNY